MHEENGMISLFFFLDKVWFIYIFFRFISFCIAKLKSPLHHPKAQRPALGSEISEGRSYSASITVPIIRNAFAAVMRLKLLRLPSEFTATKARPPVTTPATAAFTIHSCLFVMLSAPFRKYHLQHSSDIFEVKITLHDDQI